MQVDITVKDGNLKTQDISIYGGEGLTINFSAVNPGLGDGAIMTLAPSDQDDPSETLTDADGLFEISAEALGDIVAEGDNIRFWLWSQEGTKVTPRVNGTIHHRYAIGPSVILVTNNVVSGSDNVVSGSDNVVYQEAA